MSEQEQETMADIVADIRERAENAMRNGERLVHNEAVANMLTFVADRIEAAWKRDEERAVEHATRHAEAVARDNCRDCVHNPRSKNYEGGNAAAMRDIVTALANVVLPPRCKADEDGWLAWVRAMQAKARAALADATTEKSSAVGDAAAMREACQKMLDLLMLRGDGKVRCVLTWDEFNESQKMLRIALSRPPRNCDVGTPEEQSDRFADFCDSHSRCSQCPAKALWSFSNGHKPSCGVLWAQMPYKAEEGAGK